MLSSNGITRVVYLNEADLKGQIQKPGDYNFVSTDLRDVISNYEQEGLEIFRTGISPWSEERLNDLEEGKKAKMDEMIRGLQKLLRRSKYLR